MKAIDCLSKILKPTGRNGNNAADRASHPAGITAAWWNSACKRLFGNNLNTRFFSGLSVLLLGFGCLNGDLFAQSTGILTGRVLDQTDALIPGVTVDLTLPDSTVKSTLT